MYTSSTDWCAFENILVLLIFFIQSVSMAGPSHSRFKTKVAEVVLEEQNREHKEDKEAILSPDSKSSWEAPCEESDYCGDSLPKQAGHPAYQEAIQIEGDVQLRIWIQCQHDHDELSAKEGKGCCPPEAVVLHAWWQSSGWQQCEEETRSDPVL